MRRTAVAVLLVMLAAAVPLTAWAQASKKLDEKAKRLANPEKTMRTADQVTGEEDRIRHKRSVPQTTTGQGKSSSVTVKKLEPATKPGVTVTKVNPPKPVVKGKTTIIPKK